jgi:hypothetical protein
MRCCSPNFRPLTIGPVQGGDRQLTCTGDEGRPKAGQSPADRAGPGSKDHLICDGNGIPLAIALTGGNRNDVTPLMPLLGAIPLVRGKIGRPRRRSEAAYADRAMTTTNTAPRPGQGHPALHRPPRHTPRLRLR